MRYLLTFLLFIGISFGQKVVTVNKTYDNGQKVEIKKEIKDGKMFVSVTENGKTTEFTADMDDEKAVAELEEKLENKLEEHEIDGEIKIHKKTFMHDCKKENCDPSKCKHAKKECDKSAALWHMKDDDDEVRRIIKIKEPMLLDEPSGYLGVHIQNLTDQLSEYFKIKDGNGVLVSEVVEESPADKAGLKAGDVITKIDDKSVSTTAELSAAVREYEPESKVTVSIVRDGKNKNLKATLGESKMNMFLAHHNFEMPEMPDMEKFDFHALEFDKDMLKEEIEKLNEEMQELKLQFKKFQEEK